MEMTVEIGNPQVTLALVQRLILRLCVGPVVYYNWQRNTYIYVHCSSHEPLYCHKRRADRAECAFDAKVWGNIQRYGRKSGDGEERTRHVQSFQGLFR